MTEDGDTNATPQRFIDFFVIDGFLAVLGIGRLRLLAYDPRDPDCWRLDCTNNDEVLQVGVGPLVVVWWKQVQ